MELRAFFQAYPRLALAFSGGADSAYLLYAGQRWAETVRVYYVRTAFQPAFELRDAERLTAELGAALTVLDLDILHDRHITANTNERCYHCKRMIMGAICARAALDGFDTVIDGTNASDDISERPGCRALAEQGILSPLRICGITKAEVRALSREAGLFTWNKPAYACLATRIHTGERITKERLAAVEAGENALFQMGFTDFRVRSTENRALLQFTAGQQANAYARETEIRDALTPYFREIIFDPNAREAST